MELWDAVVRAGGGGKGRPLDETRFASRTPGLYGQGLALSFQGSQPFDSLTQPENGC